MVAYFPLEYKCRKQLFLRGWYVELMTESKCMHSVIKPDIKYIPRICLLFKRVHIIY